MILFEEVDFLRNVVYFSHKKRQQKLPFFM